MQSARQDAIITDINVTPLVDVCLVLVIIFMVVAPFAMQASIEVASSKIGATRGKAALGRNVKVILDAKENVFVNGRLAKWEELASVLKQAIANSRDRLVSLDASPEAKLGRVVEILDESKQNGAKKVALINPKGG